MIAFEPRPAIRPRWYQSKGVESVVDAVNRGVRRILLVLGTGGGKTILFSMLPEALNLGESERVLILAHRDELLDQAAEKLLSVLPGADVGFERGKERCPTGARICIASVQTLARASRLADFMDGWGTPTLIITDEAHHAPSPSYTAIYDAFGVKPDGEIVHVGLTATPNRGDKIALGSVFDEVALAIGMEELIADGWLVDVRGYLVETGVSLEGVHKRGGDFAIGELSERLNTPERNAKVVAAYEDLVPGSKAIVFTVDKQHARDLAQAFTIANWPCAVVDGDTPKRELHRLYAAFSRGEIRVLLNCQKLTEGYDETTIETVILARVTASPGLYTQIIGRGTRPLKEIAGILSATDSPAERRRIIARSKKPNVTVIDMLDSSRKNSVVTLPSLLGLPADFDLRGKSATRAKRAYKDLEAQNSIAAHLVHDTDTLEALEMLPESKRMSVLLQSLIEHNRATTGSNYVSIDILRPKPLPSWAAEAASMTWFASSESGFRLNVPPADSLTVEKNLVGRFEVFVRNRVNGAHAFMGVFSTIRDAFARAEDWVRHFRKDALTLVDADASWRSQKARPKQRAFLRHHGVKAPRNATRGEVSEVITLLQNTMGGESNNSRGNPQAASTQRPA